jgi:prevent-host-death family protein
MSMKPRSIPAGEFKQGCLAILDEVARTHRSIVVTKRGRPVARVVPIVEDSAREEEILGLLRGRARMLVSEREFLQPTSAMAGWDLAGKRRS